MQPDRGRDLDKELRDLGPRVEYPPTPDLAGSVRSRFDSEAVRPVPPARSGPSLWWIAAAALVVLIAVPAFSLAIRGMGGAMSAGGGSAGGTAESGDQAAEGGEAVGESRTVPLLEEQEDGPAGGASSSAGGLALRDTRPPNDESVPDVVGAPVLEACGELRTKDYVGYVLGEVKNGKIEPGRVVSQEPRAGRRGFQGQPVELIVSEPYPVEKLGRDSRCYDLTEYGPGGRPNVPNNGPNDRRNSPR